MLVFANKRKQNKKVCNIDIDSLLKKISNRTKSMVFKASVKDMLSGADYFAKQGNYLGAYNLLKIAVTKVE